MSRDLSQGQLCSGAATKDLFWAHRTLYFEQKEGRVRHPTQAETKSPAANDVTGPCGSAALPWSGTPEVVGSDPG